MCTSHCSNEIIEAIIAALAPACPERAMGGWGRRLRIALNGVNPRTGRRFIWHMFQARPGGGAQRHDGGCAGAGGDGSPKGPHYVRLGDAAGARGPPPDGSSAPLSARGPG